MIKRDIQSIEDIQLMVNTFYERIQKNEVLGPIFEEKVNGLWPEHLEKMYRFWQTILLGEHTYNGAPFPPHARMPIDESHFVIWVKTFTTTVDDLFFGDVAEEAKKRGTLMAALFNSKLEFFKKHDL
jgi:hemoglobin